MSFPPSPPPHADWSLGPALAVADAYGAMTANRPYRGAYAPEQALAEPRRCACVRFDPVVALERVLVTDPTLTGGVSVA